MKDQPSTAIATTAPSALEKPASFSFDLDVQRVVAMRAAVEKIVKDVLRVGEHCGIIPGTKKMSLLQPGSEVLCQVFRMRPEYEEMTITERDDFLAIKIRCKLFNVVTGEKVGEAIGSANSREEKYVSQTTARLCPNCGKPTIIKGKKDYGGGYLCWEKKDGCGAKFSDDDKRMVQDQSGVVNSQKVWGLYHTIESIAQKRAFVKATRTATGTSDIFTDEDVQPEEEGGDGGGHATSKPTGAATTTAPKAEVVKYANAVEIRDLAWAIRDSKMCARPDIPTGLEREAAEKAKRKEWINKTLAEMEQPAIDDVTKITSELAVMLTEMAKKNVKPEGWV